MNFYFIKHLPGPEKLMGGFLLATLINTFVGGASFGIVSNKISAVKRFVQETMTEAGLNSEAGVTENSQ